MKPGKLFKFIAIFIVSLIITAAVSVVSIYHFFPEKKLLKMIVKQSEEVVHRKLKIGKLNYSLRGVRLYSVEIHESMDAASPILLKADSIELMFSPLSLLKRRIVLNYLDIHGLDLTIDYIDERYNIMRLISDIASSKKEESKKEKSVFKTTLPTVRLFDSKINLKSCESVFEPLKGSYSGINCEVDIDLDKNHITANNVSAVLPPGRGKMECSVKIDILENDFKIYGKVNVQNGSLKWVYKWGTNLSLPYSSVTGTVSDLVVTKNYTEGRVKAVSTLDDGSVIDASGYCKVDYTTTTNVSMVLANIKGTVNNSAINLKKFYLNFDTGQLYFTAGPVDANISDIRKIVSQIPRDLNGRISGNLSLSKGSYDGILTLTDVSYGQDKMIKSINAVIQINNNVFSSEKINLELFDQPAVVSIASTNSSLNDFVLTILVKDFNVPAKHSKGTQLSMNSTGQSNTNGIKVRGNIIIENLKSGEYYLKNTEINYGFEKNVLTVNKLKTSFLDTVIDGKGSVDLQKKFPEINVDLNFNNFKVQALSIYLKNIENRFYGSASGKANLFMRLDSEPVKSVKGTLEVKIDNGKLVNTGIQNGLGIILEPLKYKLQDLEFSTIYSNINIEEKGYKINSFVFDAPDIQLSMNGFLESDFGGDLNILLHFNKNFIKDIPNFTFPQLNKYKENNTYSIKINAKGADVTNSNYIKVIDE